MSSPPPARSIAGLLNWWRSRFSRSKGPSSARRVFDRTGGPSRTGETDAKHLRTGTQGETLACRFLRRNGYKVLYRNFKGRSGGEIDIVCRDRDTLVFVEVKTRTREDFGRPIDAVNQQKQKRISRGALAWLRMLDNPEVLFRFDVVEVTLPDDGKPRLELVRNAFQLSAPYIY